MVEKKPEYGDLIRICRVLEGLPRHASTHAAGVVISDRPLVEYLPLFRGKKGEVVTQFDMKIVEKIGLVKFDFLGLRNLTVIADAEELIRRQGKTAAGPAEPGPRTTPRPTSCSPRATPPASSSWKAPGMKDLLVRLKPGCFPDVIALVALYRPGPMESGMIDDYVDRKHGRKQVAYIVPQLEPILQETYGVIVYQEQVMKIAGALAELLHGRGRRPAQGHGQEDPRDHGRPPGAVSEGSGRQRAARRQGRRICSTSWRSSAATASTSRTARPTR